MGNARMLSRSVAAVFVLGLFIAGCSDADGDPTPTAGPTVSESGGESPNSPEPTSAAPGPTPWPEPTRPAAMERDDIEGAKAAAEYFLALYPYVYVTGDLSVWREMVHPECNFCASVISNVEDMHSKGGFADGPTVDILAVNAAPPDDDYEYYAVWVDVREGRHAYYDEDGSVVQQFDSSTVEISLALTRRDMDWLVRGVTVEEAEGIDSDA